jgi:glycosyltransferase involved in cell wall biosynthesis
MSWPLISIVTPSYNQAEHLEATLRSVQEQDYPALEHILIDGASTDGSLEIIRRHGAHLAYWESEADAGQAQALNKGFRRARGEILCWLNSDDVYRPGTLRAVAEVFGEQPELDVAYGGIDLIDPAGTLLSTLSAGPFDLRQQVCATNLMPQPSTFFRRRIYERLGDLNERLHYVMDYEYWVRAGLAGARIAPVSSVWAGFRLHEASKTVAQPLRFAEEFRQVVDSAFEVWGAPPGWRAEAESNLQQYLAEAYLKSGQPGLARQAYLQAALRYPWRLRTLVLLGFAANQSLGARLRGWYWRLTGRSALRWLR